MQWFLEHGIPPQTVFRRRQRMTHSEAGSRRSDSQSIVLDMHTDEVSSMSDFIDDEDTQALLRTEGWILQLGGPDMDGGTTQSESYLVATGIASSSRLEERRNPHVERQLEITTRRFVVYHIYLCTVLSCVARPFL